MKRNVMIAGHDDLWVWQSIEKRTRLLELVRTCPLCEVAGDCDEVWLNFTDDCYQRIDQQRVHAPEVQVRKMNYFSHTRSSSTFCIFWHNHAQCATANPV